MREKRLGEREMICGAYPLSSGTVETNLKVRERVFCAPSYFWAERDARERKKIATK